MKDSTQPGADGNINPMPAYQKVDQSLIPTYDTLSKSISPIAIGNEGGIDIIDDKIYDSMAIAASTTYAGTKLFGAIQANLYDGNLTSNAGTMPSPEGFFVKAIRFTVESDAQPMGLIAVTEILRRGTFDFRVSNKSYARGKLIDFLNPLATIVRDNSASGSEKYFIGHNAFKPLLLKVGVPLPPSRAFSVTVSLISGAIASGTHRLFCFLEGFAYRGVS